MIGNWLREKREYWELTSQDMISAMGVSPTLISLVETDKRIPSIKFLITYIETLAKAACFDETLKEMYITDENFIEWQKTLKINETLDKIVYSSIIGKIVTSYDSNQENDNKKLKEYFMEYSWRDFAYYQENYFSLSGFKPTKHRLNKKIDIIDSLNLDELVTSYWLNLYKLQLTDFIESNIVDLPPAYRKLHLSLKKAEDSQERFNKTGDIELNQIEHHKLLLDGKLLTPKEKDIIYTVIEGIRQRRKFK